MEDKKYKVLGMMSGTSLDGLDIAYCEFWRTGNQWNYEIKETTTVDYTKTWRTQLKNAIHLSKEAHDALHVDYGKWLGEAAYNFINQHGLNPDFIASHGHTSHHRPEEGITFQLGYGQALASTSRQKVICDFRTLDVALQGQGAPLVPIGDRLLLHTYDYCLNLGGISNISFETNGQRIAFDIGLANMPLNDITARIGLEYDKGGALAKSGTLHESFYNELNALEYYSLPYPKSTGYEWYSFTVKPLIDSYDLPVADLLHTLIQHNAHQIANVIKRTSTKPTSKLLVTGGGAFNDFFVHCLREKLDDICQVEIPSGTLIGFKEAMVFAFMGVLRDRNEVNVLASVTGATKDSSSGEIFYPKI